jgi:CO/xanthine dehydrogenase Mo-binding subunit
MGFTIMENFKIKDGKAMTRNMQTYLVPTAADIPEIKVTPVEIEEKEGPYGAKGLGEPASIPITPAITNAIYDAAGIRIKDLPASPERILMELCAK